MIVKCFPDFLGLCTQIKCLFFFFLLNHEQDPVNFKNQSSYWICGQLPMSSNSGLPCWISPLPGSDWMALRKFILEERKSSSVLANNITK